MDRETMAALWTNAREQGVGHIAWKRLLEGVSGQQASWTPGPGRHSICQIICHMVFWREYVLRALEGDRPDQAEIDRRNWGKPEGQHPSKRDEGAWEATLERLERSWEQVLEAVHSGRMGPDHLDDFMELLGHDAYHAGQIMQLRALQGASPPRDSPWSW